MNELGRIRYGFETLARALASTLGPGRGAVLSAVGRGGGERLTDSATIARRITALPGRGESAGAALAREMVRRMGERYGDGGATAAVVADGILRQASKVVAAGADPVLVRAGISAGAAVAGDAVKTQAHPVACEPELAALAATATGDAALAAAVAELADVLGPEGATQVEEFVTSTTGTRLSHGFIDGARWGGRPADSGLLPEGKTELTLIEPTVVVADDEVKRVEQILPLLEVAPALPGRPPLVLVARGIGDEALSALIQCDRRGSVVNAPVVLTTTRTRLSEDLADIALLTGATVLAAECGLPMEKVRREHLGRARQVVVRRPSVTVVDGHGDRSAAAGTAARVREYAWDLDDRRARQRLWLRQARLLGRVGYLRVGALTEQLSETRRAEAEKAIDLVHTALRDGAVAGGGVCFLDCVPAVREARSRCGSDDEALGMDAVRCGLEAPFLRLVANASELEPRVMLEKARSRGPGYGVDVRTGTVVDMAEAGIRDLAGVARGALQAAGETAGLLISAEVVTGHD